MNKRTCTFVADDGTLCGKPLSCKGLCNGHYEQVRLGRPLTPLSRTALTTEQRFWRYVDKTDDGGCWLWNGHPQFHVNGRKVYAHRFAWELLVGPIPDGYKIDHDDPDIGCGRPLCVNPAHVKPVPKGTNIHNGRGLSTANTSGYRNISWEKQRSRWRVQIRKDDRTYHGGYFVSQSDAIAARDALEARLYGDAA